MNEDGPPIHDSASEELLMQYIEATKMLADPEIKKAVRKLQGKDSALEAKLESLADEKVGAMRAVAKTILEEENTTDSKDVRIFIDGCFDLIHSGHYNAIRQAKNMCDFLVVGVCSDEDLIRTKGPSVLNCKERAEILRHCKFADEVVAGTPYTPTFEVLKSVNCTFYAHGDDPCIDAEGVDITLKFKEKNAYKVFKRTEGVSTTDITGKLLALANFT